MSHTNLQGLGLFLFIPVVLVLFLRQPLGPGASVALGLAIMFGHRFVAAPWARGHAAERCGWCAGRVGGGRTGVAVMVEGAGQPWRLVACSSRHANALARFLTFVRRWRLAIAAGIFVPLGLLLAGSLGAAVGRPFLPADLLARQFRFVVAVVVVATSFAYVSVRTPDDTLVSPFPLHNLLLLGVRQTLWVFRVVGAWWLLDELLK